MDKTPPAGIHLGRHRLRLVAVFQRIRPREENILTSLQSGFPAIRPTPAQSARHDQPLDRSGTKSPLRVSPTPAVSRVLANQSGSPNYASLDHPQRGALLRRSREGPGLLPRGVAGDRPPLEGLEEHTSELQSHS